MQDCVCENKITQDLKRLSDIFPYRWSKPQKFISFIVFFSFDISFSVEICVTALLWFLCFTAAHLWATSAFSQRANLHNVQELLQPASSIFEQMGEKLQYGWAGWWYFTVGLGKFTLTVLHSGFNHSCSVIGYKTKFQISHGKLVRDKVNFCGLQLKIQFPPLARRHLP